MYLLVICIKPTGYAGLRQRLAFPRYISLSHVPPSCSDLSMRAVANCFRSISRTSQACSLRSVDGSTDSALACDQRACFHPPNRPCPK